MTLRKYWVLSRPYSTCHWSRVSGDKSYDLLQIAWPAVSHAAAPRQASRSFSELMNVWCMYTVRVLFISLFSPFFSERLKNIINLFIYWELIVGWLVDWGWILFCGQGKDKKYLIISKLFCFWVCMYRPRWHCTTAFPWWWLRCWWWWWSGRERCAGRDLLHPPCGLYVARHGAT